MINRKPSFVLEWHTQKSKRERWFYMVSSLRICRYIMLCGYPPFYGQCGEDCGWERGEPCQDCQDSLFTRIQDGIYDFPDNEWKNISSEAKDLIQKLLVRDPRKRLSAVEVLHHPWVMTPPAATPLATPRVLTRFVFGFFWGRITWMVVKLSVSLWLSKIDLYD